MGAITISDTNTAETIPAGGSSSDDQFVVLTANASNDSITLDGFDFIHGRPAGTNPFDFIATGTDSDTINASNATITGSGGGYLVSGKDPSDNTLTLGGTGNFTVYGGVGSVTDNSGGGNNIYALKPGNHTVTAASGDNIVVRDGIHAPGNATTVTVFNFAPGDHIALSQSVGEHLFNSTNLASSIATHISGNTFTADHLTINFVGHTPVSADFILVA